ncbi:hypothetical protein MUP56_01045 [Patescibacteria group bacterium]|nr:hypothetical protein [Patescibacteria group bacterium]
MLTIDTSKTDETKVTLEVDGIRREKLFASNFHTSQQVLPLLEELCHEFNISIREITNICVHTGPGSFTGLRVGASIGNTLGWFLNVPVNGKKTPVTKLDYGNDHWG